MNKLITGDRVIRTRMVNSTQTMHRCTVCNKIVPFGRKMMLAVVAASDRIYSTYYCPKCAKNTDIFTEDVIACKIN